MAKLCVCARVTVWVNGVWTTLGHDIVVRPWRTGLIVYLSVAGLGSWGKRWGAGWGEG